MTFETAKKKIAKAQKDYDIDASKAKKRMTSELSVLEYLIDNFETKYADAKNPKAVKKVEEYKKDLKELTKQCKDFMAIKAAKDSETTEQKGLKPPKRKMQKQELIALGDQMQSDGLKRLENINRNVDNGYQMVIDGNVALDEQHEKMMQAAEHVLEMGTALKRSQEYLSYFSREFYQDKFVRIMTLLIILITIVIVVWALVKRSKKPATTTATTTTNSTAVNATNSSIEVAFHLLAPTFY